MSLDELLALLPDNNTGEIDAADLRTIVTDLWNTSEANRVIAVQLVDLVTTGRLSVAALNATIAQTSKVVEQAIDAALEDAYAAPPPWNVPVITWSVSTVIASPVIATPKRIGDVSTADADMAGDTHWRYLGVPDGSIVAYAGSAGVQGALKPGGSAGASGWNPIIEFDTAASVSQVEVVFRAVADGYSPSMVWVDGRRVSIRALYSNLAGAGQRSMVLTFPDARVRRIQVSFWGRETPLYSVRVGAGLSISRPAGSPSRTLAVIGDSHTDGSQGGTWGVNMFSNWPTAIGQALRYEQVVYAGIGGTKWVQSGTGDAALSHFGGRLPDVLDLAPQTLIFMGSVNDDHTNQAAIQAAVEATLGDVTGVDEVYVVGTFRPQWTENAAVKAGAEAAGVKFIDINSLVLGTGDLDSPARDGNADFYIGNDGVHLTPSGARAVARAILGGIYSARIS